MTKSDAWVRNSFVEKLSTRDCATLKSAIWQAYPIMASMTTVRDVRSKLTASARATGTMVERDEGGASIESPGLERALNGVVPFHMTMLSHESTVDLRCFVALLSGRSPVGEDLVNDYLHWCEEGCDRRRCGPRCRLGMFVYLEKSTGYRPGRESKQGRRKVIPAAEWLSWSFQWPR